MTETELSPNLDAILADLMPAAQRLAARRRRHVRYRRSAALAVLAIGLLASAAAAGFEILGSPAPPAVKRDLVSVDRGMPRDMRLNPDVASARAVAASDGSIVYFAALKDGGYCAELVTAAAGPRGAVCSTGQQAAQTPLGVTIPFTDPVTDESMITVSGHVTARDARSVELVYPEGGSQSVPLGAHDFYVADVPSEYLAAVHRHGMMLIARDADGAAVAEAIVPADAVTPPSEADRPHDPIEIDTVSTESDFTQVLRVRGHLYLDGVDHMTLRYADGHTVRIAVSGRGFDYPVPPDRRRALATPGTLTAWSADGMVLAQRPVAAVAYWRGRNP